jgi:DNA-binding NarL/FixJ family response regulator
MPVPVRVFAVDDSEVFLDALREVLAACPEFELIGEASSAEAALPAVKLLAPDVVLIDVTLPGMDGLEACRRIYAMPSPPLVILTSVADDPHSDAKLSCPDAPFVPKAKISRTALRDAWASRQPPVSATPLASGQ